MLAANANFEIRLHTATALSAHSNQLANAISIEHLKRIVSHDLSFDVVRQEAAGIVATQPECSLRQVVCTEREKLRVLRNAIGHERRAWQLDHRSHEILDSHAMLA